jgi:hypothetical protein
MDDVSLSEWLRLREAADFRARASGLTNAVVARLRRDRTLSVLDLATGAGSNFRFLVERLPSPQRWLVVDRSPTLLDDLQARTQVWAEQRGYRVEPTAEGFLISGLHLRCDVACRVQDLAALEDRTLFSGRDLVTASALLDLVSESWLKSLARQCRMAQATVLLTITYDGRFSCSPAEPEDETVRGAMNEHQHRDKGLGGPAEGPQAAASAERCFAEEGFIVDTMASDWVLGREDAAMQRTLIEGWAEAASEVLGHQAAAIASWRGRRLAHVDAGRSDVIVGHRDLAAWLD